MKAENNWTLTMMATREDGEAFFLQPVSGVHAHMRELLDCGMALLEFTMVVPRSKAEELLYATAIDEAQQPEPEQSQFASSD